MAEKTTSKRKAKNIITCILLSALVMLFSESCTIQKRTFRKGYHIEWKGFSEKKATINPTENLNSELPQLTEITSTDSLESKPIENKTIISRTTSDKLNSQKETARAKGPNTTSKIISYPSASAIITSDEQYLNRATEDSGDNVELIWFGLVVPILVIAAVLYGVSPGAAATGVALYIFLVIIAIAVITVIALLIFILLNMLINSAKEMK